jgi:hypothetical protein
MPADGLSEEQVSRLLAEAGDSDPGPLPADVASRLDAVLADLVAERAEPATADPVVAIATARERRRRAWAPRLLVAAAVLGVAGLGVSVLDDLTSGGSESATAGDAAGSESASGADSGADSGGGDSASSEAAEEAPGGGDTGAMRGNRDDAANRAQEPEALRTPRTAADALRMSGDLRITDAASLRTAVRTVAVRDLADDASGGTATDSDGSGSGALEQRAALRYAGCVAPSGPGRRSLVTYRDSPATLVVRRVGDRLDGRVYDCGLGLLLDGVEIGPRGE